MGPPAAAGATGPLNWPCLRVLMEGVHGWLDFWIESFYGME